MKAVFIGLLKALGEVIIKMLASMAGEAFMKWLFFYTADIIVKSTKTPHDDAFLAKAKEAYDKAEESK